MLSQQGFVEDLEPNTLLIEGRTRSRGFVQLPKLVLYARNLSRDAKLLYVVLLGYAWQEQRCFPGYKRLCDDLDASENMVRKYMRELEAVHLLSQRRRGQGRSNMYLLHDLRTSKIEVQDQHKIAVLEPQESDDYVEAGERQTDEEENRPIGERPLIKSLESAGQEEKALVRGEPAEFPTPAPGSVLALGTVQRRVTAVPLLLANGRGGKACRCLPWTPPGPARFAALGSA